ncbi:aspartate/glutamate racemase family protein [Pseudescherichia sp.]|uniref:aspartate/glutamate racemase family protein n=1 Tax=Pseudescherichia sp. TaxID=2055881 RepID=UPI002897CB33|nr:aspartate/glutamate racemase family protein [Pseudescherichia sp.]
MSQRIVLIHATPLAVAPINDTFKQLWPEAEISNLLDDALSVDRAKETTLTPRLCQRIDTLVEYAISIDAAAVLFTCSAFGAAIEASAQQKPLPVLKPNEAMFEDALGKGRNIVMLATFGPAVKGMEEEFRELAAARHADVTLSSYVVPGARNALNAGNAGLHNQLIVEAAMQYQEADAILLAHFSMEIAYQQVSSAVSCAVLSSPQSAVNKLKRVMN